MNPLEDDAEGFVVKQTPYGHKIRLRPKAEDDLLKAAEGIVFVTQPDDFPPVHGIPHRDRFGDFSPDVARNHGPEFFGVDWDPERGDLGNREEDEP